MGSEFGGVGQTQVPQDAGTRVNSSMGGSRIGVQPVQGTGYGGGKGGGGMRPDGTGGASVGMGPVQTQPAQLAGPMPGRVPPGTSVLGSFGQQPAMGGGMMPPPQGGGFMGGTDVYVPGNPSAGLFRTPGASAPPPTNPSVGGIQATIDRGGPLVPPGVVKQQRQKPAASLGGPLSSPYSGRPGRQ